MIRSYGIGSSENLALKYWHSISRGLGKACVQELRARSLVGLGMTERGQGRGARSLDRNDEWLTDGLGQETLSGSVKNRHTWIVIQTLEQIGFLCGPLYWPGAGKGDMGRAESVHHLPFFFTITLVTIPLAVISAPLGPWAPGTS